MEMTESIGFIARNKRWFTWLGVLLLCCAAGELCFRMVSLTFMSWLSIEAAYVPTATQAMIHSLAQYLGLYLLAVACIFALYHGIVWMTKKLS